MDSGQKGLGVVANILEDRKLEGYLISVFKVICTIERLLKLLPGPIKLTRRTQQIVSSNFLNIFRCFFS